MKNFSLHAILPCFLLLAFSILQASAQQAVLNRPVTVAVQDGTFSEAAGQIPGNPYSSASRSMSGKPLFTTLPSPRHPCEKYSDHTLRNRQRHRLFFYRLLK